MLYSTLIILVQTIGESLPISSSGHVALLLLIFQKYFTFLQPNLFSSDLFEPWFHSLHLLTALILAIFFFKDWFFLLIHLARTWRIVLKLIFLVGIADCITFFWYILFHHYPLQIPLFLGFLITGMVLLSLKFIKNQNQTRSFCMRDALILGLMQSIALLPGISRFAITFCASRWLGYSNLRAFHLTWMIQFPLITAAALVGFYQLYDHQMLASFYAPPILAVCLLAFLGGYLALAFAYRCAITNKFWKFGYYLALPTMVALLI